MPALKGSALAATPGRFTPHLLEPSAGDVRLWCGRTDCDWTTVRPEWAAWSARESHRIQHAKGMI